MGVEPTTSRLQIAYTTNCATPPFSSRPISFITRIRTAKISFEVKFIIQEKRLQEGSFFIYFHFLCIYYTKKFYKNQVRTGRPNPLTSTLLRALRTGGRKKKPILNFKLYLLHMR